MLMDVRFSEKQKREEEEEEEQGMRRPPCCDKDGIKKGPWTPEEDIILASYIKEHGPGNWRSVPTNTGLLRCSKSCRLRWTNYLRPGIKRGNFTTHEERMIVHLQALLGNKWASIASYLPQRTDNDIKNYWNTHLKKKTKKFQSSLDPLISSSPSTSQLLTRRYTDKRSKDLANQASLFRLNQTSTYASSTENISRLLEGWMNTSPKTVTTAAKNQEEEAPGDDNGNNSSMSSGNSHNNLAGTSSNQCDDLADDNTEHEGYDLISHEDFESLLSFDNMSNMAWDKNSTESNYHGSQTSNTHKNISHSVSKTEQRLEDQPPLSLLEKWLLDESSAQVGEMMDLYPIF